MDKDIGADRQENKKQNRPIRVNLGMRDRSETGYSVHEQFKNTTTTINQYNFM